MDTALEVNGLLPKALDNRQIPEEVFMDIKTFQLCDLYFEP